MHCSQDSIIVAIVVLKHSKHYNLNFTTKAIAKAIANHRERVSLIHFLTDQPALKAQTTITTRVVLRLLLRDPSSQHQMFVPVVS